MKQAEQVDARAGAAIPVLRDTTVLQAAPARGLGVRPMRGSLAAT
jgi:hypothetical protein